jgi:hypothetical protein
MKTHHYKDLKYDWGYSCRICQTWQHQCQLIDIQQGYAAKMILASMADNEIYYCDSTLQEFIEAAEALDMDYDYQKTDVSEGVASRREAVASHLPRGDAKSDSAAYTLRDASLKASHRASRASGYDFQAWHLENQETFARIKL